MELELVKTEASSAASFNQSAEYRKIAPLGKIPAFEGANGYTLSEVIAIAIYSTYPLPPAILHFYFWPFYDEYSIIFSYPWQNYILLITHQL